MNSIHHAYLRPQATEKQQARMSKIASLFVKVGAIAFIALLDPQFSIDLQLIGGVIVLQTAPALMFSPDTRRFDRRALIADWVAGMTSGLWMLWLTPNTSAGKAHFGGSQFALSHLGFDTAATIYTGTPALVLNALVAVAVTLVLRAFKIRDHAPDRTVEADYHAEEANELQPAAAVPVGQLEGT